MKDANLLLHSRAVSRRNWESFTRKLAFLGQIRKHAVLNHSQTQLQAGLVTSLPQAEPVKVVEPDLSSEPISLLPSTQQNHPLNRWIFIWMESTFRQITHLPGTLVKGRAEPSHYHSRGTGCDKDDRISKPPRPPHLSPYRQQIGEVCNKLRSKAPALYPYLTILCHLKYRHISITAFRNPSSLNLIADALSRDHNS